MASDKKAFTFVAITFFILAGIMIAFTMSNKSILPIWITNNNNYYVFILFFSMIVLLGIVIWLSKSQS